MFGRWDWGAAWSGSDTTFVSRMIMRAWAGSFEIHRFRGSGIARRIQFETAQLLSEGCERVPQFQPILRMRHLVEDRANLGFGAEPFRRCPAFEHLMGLFREIWDGDRRHNLTSAGMIALWKADSLLGVGKNGRASLDAPSIRGEAAHGWGTRQQKKGRSRSPLGMTTPKKAKTRARCRRGRAFREGRRSRSWSWSGW